MGGSSVIEANQLLAEAIDIARDVACVHVISGGGEFSGTVAHWFRADNASKLPADGKCTVSPD
jgi:DNA-nicking Smr family endonuclease